MVVTVLEALIALTAVAGMYGALSLLVRGCKKKQREMIGRRLGRAGEDDLSTAQAPIQTQVGHYESANAHNDEQYRHEPAKK
jgi:hypothetical protein